MGKLISQPTRICIPGDLNPSESVRQEGDVPTCYPIARDIACTLTHFHSLEILVGRVTQSDSWQVLPRGHDLPTRTTGCLFTFLDRVSRVFPLYQPRRHFFQSLQTSCEREPSYRRLINFRISRPKLLMHNTVQFTVGVISLISRCEPLRSPFRIARRKDFSPKDLETAETTRGRSFLATPAT